MDLYFECEKCTAPDVWRIRIHGTRPHARALIGDVSCPVCHSMMMETGPCDCIRLKEMHSATG